MEESKQLEDAKRALAQRKEACMKVDERLSQVNHDFINKEEEERQLKTQHKEV